MRRSDRIVMSSLFTLLILLTGWFPASAQEAIDWEGLPAGTYLCGSIPSPAACVSIQSAAGDPILIDGFDPVHGLGVNAAMIFDSNCLPGGNPADCSGDDSDLGSPNELCDVPPGPGPGQGSGGEPTGTSPNCPLVPLDNILIVSENLDPADPDDSARLGTQITVDFSQLQGMVTLFSVNLLDLEQVTASVQMFDADNNLLFTLTPVPPTGDNGLATIEFNGPGGVSGVDRMVVLFDGSASLDTIIFLQEPDEPSIDIRKQAEGPDLRTFPSGSDVTFEIVVTNTGDVDLENVVVTDVLAPECDNAIGFLAAGDSVAYTCTVTGVTSGFDNEACVEGERNSVTVGDCDPSTVVIEAPGCTHTWGYWKTHSEFGPAPYDDTWALLPSGASTPFFGTGLTYHEILQTSSSGGNKYIGLAHQYIAAELSVLSGASIPPEVLAGWLEAQALLIAYEGQQDIPKRSADRRRAVELGFLLDQYNKGVIGPGHCPD